MDPVSPEEDHHHHYHFNPKIIQTIPAKEPRMVKYNYLKDFLQ